MSRACTLQTLYFYIFIIAVIKIFDVDCNYSRLKHIDA